MTDYSTRIKTLWNFLDNKDSIIERWSRELGKQEPLARYNLTAAQRRVIAAFRWERKVAELQGERDGMSPREQQPPPVAGLDANKRIVVQRIKNGKLEMWALTREGSPWDIKLPLRSLKDGRLVEVPPHIHTIESD